VCHFVNLVLSVNNYVIMLFYKCTSLVNMIGGKRISYA
jgi:hypothetical protein